MIPQKVADVAYAGTGIAATSFPWWSEWLAILAGANQAVIQFGGLVIVVLTVLKVFTEWRIARRRLQDTERDK